MQGIKYISNLDPTGYGQSGRAYLRGLMQARIPVKWQPMVKDSQPTNYFVPFKGSTTGDSDLDSLYRADIPYDTVILHTLPENYPALIEREMGKRLIGYTVWETDKLRLHWPPILNQLDLVLVPCEWNIEVFRRGGVTGPIIAVPHILETPSPEIGYPIPGVRESDYVFYQIADWQHRKAPWSALEVYWRTFSRHDPVRFVLKTVLEDWTRFRPGRFWKYFGKRFFNTRLAVFLRRSKHLYPAPVTLITSELTDAQIRALHTRGDCYIALTHSEGWGLGAFDAAGYGNPVIMTGYGGQRDFLPEDFAYLVDYELDYAARSVGRFIEGRWAIPDQEQAAQFMRYVFENRDKALRKGALLKEFVQEQFNDAKVTAKLLQAIESLEVENV